MNNIINDGFMRESAWLHFFQLKSVPSAPPPVWMDTKLGIDLLVNTDNDGIVIIQSKSSIAGALKFLQASMDYGKFIPFVIGDPIMDEDPDEVLDALVFNGVYWGDCVEASRSQRNLFEDEVAYALSSIGRWIPENPGFNQFIADRGWR